MPLPGSLVVKNGSKMRAPTSGIPGPGIFEYQRNARGTVTISAASGDGPQRSAGRRALRRVH